MQRPHFPTPLAALLLVIGAWLVTFFGVSLQIDPGDPQAPLDPGFAGVAQALGFGLVATLAARRVPGPQAERLGLTPLTMRYWPIVAMGVPMAIVASELDNWLAMALPAIDPEAFQRALDDLQTLTPLAVAQAVIFRVGIEPVVTEFLFRGVIQQGLIAYLGRFAGVAITAALSVDFASAIATNGSPGSAAIVSLLLGIGLGYLRIGTGSLLAVILVRATWNALGLFGVIYAAEFPVAGFNTFGEHVDPVLLATCLACVFWAGAELRRAVQEQPVVLPIVEDVESHEEDDGGNFL